jgi:tetratricopeptide (TPR) repeat protein
VEENRRLDELRRRVDKDPASIAFASLAEELRKAGEHDEAIRVCRAGLEHHPGYVSAHVTLGRALLELQQYPEARTELEFVLHAAPDNLLALKCMSELQERAAAEPAAPVEAPLEPAPSLSFAPAPSLSFAAATPPLSFSAPTPPLPADPTPEPPAPSLSFAPAPSLSFAAPPPPAESSPEPTPEPPVPAPDPALGELEEWQASIQADRARRSGGSPSQ